MRFQRKQREREIGNERKELKIQRQYFEQQQAIECDMKRVAINSDIDAFDARNNPARQRKKLPFKWKAEKLSDVSSWAPNSDKFDFSFYSLLNKRRNKLEKPSWRS